MAPDTVPGLTALADVRHGFFDRRGGVSTGRLASLNLAMRDGERAEALRENWIRAARALHPSWSDAQVAIVDQVHADGIVEVVSPSGCLATLGPADAMFTTRPDVVLAVRTADCVPVLVAGPGVVAAIHAGWRGVAAGIVGKTLARMAEVTGIRPEDCVAAVGPHISAASYEVGPEVVAGIAASGVPPEVFVRPERHVDLRAAVAHQLTVASVSAIEHVHRCTLLDSDLFSHRREGPVTGRQAALIGRRP